MSARPTAAAFTLASLAAWALFMGVISGQVEPFLVAVPLLVALFASGTRIDSSTIRLTHELSRTRLFEGDALAVRVAATARAPIALGAVVQPLPEGAQLLSGRPRAIFSLRAGQEIRWEYVIRCAGRGGFMLGLPHVRVWDESGLFAVESPYEGPGQAISVYPRLTPLRHLPSPLRTQVTFGNYVGARLGEGLEPGEIRPFAPGDRIRLVNWRASLRLGKLHVTQFHEELNADIVLLIDTLSETGVRPNSTLDHAARACGALASAFLARKDRVGLIEYSGVVRWTRPAAGRAQFERIMDSLLRVEVAFSYLKRDLDFLPARVLPPQALVVAVTPLLDNRFLTVLTDLAGRGFDLVVLAILPIELNRRIVPRSALNELTTRLWALEWRAHAAELTRAGISVVEWDPDRPLELALARFGRRRGTRSRRR